MLISIRNATGVIELVTLEEFLLIEAAQLEALYAMASKDSI